MEYYKKHVFANTNAQWWVATEIFYDYELVRVSLSISFAHVYWGYNNRSVGREVESRRDGLTNISVLSHAVLK